MTHDQFRDLRESFDKAKALEGRDLQEFLTSVRNRDAEVAQELNAMLGSQAKNAGFLEPTAETVSAAPKAASAKAWHTLRSEDVVDGRYEIVEVLGEGGFGKAYLARDHRLDNRKVVLKTLKPAEHSWHEKRFQEEIRALARLDHPGIVSVIDSGRLEEDGAAYLVMQFVPGQTLQTVMDDKLLGADRALKLLRQVCEPLIAAHEAGILHRDLKPANILVRDAGTPDERAVLIDFGLARTDTEGAAEAQTTIVSGTPRYMAPEQMVGRTSAASDLFSLGLVAIEMCTGKPLDRRAEDLDLRPAARAALAKVEPPLPAPAVEAIAKAVSHMPAERYSSVRDFASALTPPPAAQVVEKRSMLWPVAAVAAIAIIAAVVWWSSRPAPSVTLRASLGLRQAQGTEPILPGSTLHAGDSVEFRFQPSETGYLYVFDEADSKFAVLFPGGDRVGVPVAARTAQRIPESAADWIKLDGLSPEEWLWVVWSRKRVPQLDDLQKYSRLSEYGVVPASETAYLREMLKDSGVVVNGKDLEWRSQSDKITGRVQIQVR